MNTLKRLRSIIAFVLLLAKSPTQRKHIFNWLQSLRPNYLLDKPSPWISFDAIDFISQHVKPQWKVFEYGSGGSTLFWLSKGCDCVSVEHDSAWSNTLTSRFSSTTKIVYRFIAPELLPDSGASSPVDVADPTSYRSGAGDYLNYSFKKYVESIDEYPDGYFDLILVDGRARPSCMLRSISKLKPGGLLVLDNAERKYYLAKTQSLLSKFTKHEFKGSIPSLYSYVQTNVYEKPAS